MINGVLQGALLGGEAVAERLELVVVGGGGQLGLDARLEAGLGLGHELGAVDGMHPGESWHCDGACGLSATCDTERRATSQSRRGRSTPQGWRGRGP